MTALLSGEPHPASPERRGVEQPTERYICILVRKEQILTRSDPLFAEFFLFQTNQSHIILYSQLYIIIVYPKEVFVNGLGKGFLYNFEYDFLDKKKSYGGPGRSYMDN